MNPEFQLCFVPKLTIMPIAKYFVILLIAGISSINPVSAQSDKP